ncbi:MAG: molybdate ABC transporter substrate-binding protein [Desulfobulbaceae bacterium A2]|nr:MAG: molybdate ABC transporter substrate-binding protein [Desulfobulbaceae bacterium A2]
MRRIIIPLALAMLVFSTPLLHAAELIVSAGASLTEAFEDLKPLFEHAHPGVTVRYNFAATGPLLAQLAQGAPVDVFASADQKSMDEAVAKNLVDSGSRVNFARNELVIATPVGGKAVASLADLSRPDVQRIGIGNPDSVPVGRYSKAALEKAGLWEPLNAKLIMGESVRQVLDYIARGEVDAGFVYATDAKKAGDKVAVTAVIPLDKPVSYPLAVTSGTKSKELARAFVELVTGPQGQKALAARGFVSP